MGVIEKGTYTPNEDIDVGNITILHSLGVIPEFISVYADKIKPKAGWRDSYLINSYVSIMKTNFENTFGNCCHFSAATCPGRKVVSYGTFFDDDISKFADSTKFRIPFYMAHYKLKAGVTYHYVVGVYE